MSVNLPMTMAITMTNHDQSQLLITDGAHPDHP